MNRIRYTGRTLLLAALAVGLNLLAHANMLNHSSAHHSRVNYSHLLPHGSSRSTMRGERSQRLHASENSSADKVATNVSPKLRTIDPVPVSSAAALLSATNFMHENTVSEPLAQVNVLAAGSAPRAPGGSRAPPIA